MTRSWWKLTLAVAALPLLAQNAPGPLDATRMILVPFHVVNEGHQVAGLTQNDILLLEDGAPRPVSYFAGPAAGGDLALFGRKPARPAAPIEMVILIDTTGGSTLEELQYPEKYRDLTRYGSSGPLGWNAPDPQSAFAKWLKEAFLDAVATGSISVYGFHQSLTRYCRQTRDLKALTAAIRNADGGSRGVTVAPRDKHARLSWDDAMVATARDSVAAPVDAVRIMMPILRGLPSDEAHPMAVAALCRDLGITVYPLFRDLAWPDYPQLPQNADGVVEFPGGAPATADNALNLGMMTRQERGAYVSLKQRQFEEYGKLGEDTGGRSDDPRDSLESILADIEYREDWAYAAGIAPSGAPRAHRLEVRLRDPNSGALQGGTRTAVY